MQACVGMCRHAGKGDLVAAKLHTCKMLFAGTVAVTNGSDEMMSMLGEGAVVGELAMLAISRRTANCVCLTHCDLCVLPGGALNQVMKVRRLGN